MTAPTSTTGSHSSPASRSLRSRRRPATPTRQRSARGVDLVQVSAYGGLSSSLPYIVRVREAVVDPVAACAAYTGTGGVAGTLPDLGVAARPTPAP